MTGKRLKRRTLEMAPMRSRARLRFPGLAIPAGVLDLLFPIAAVVGARGLLVGLSIGLSLLPVRGVIAALLLEDLLSVLEVVATAPNRTTGFAAPTEAVPVPRSAIILGQGLALCGNRRRVFVFKIV